MFPIWDVPWFVPWLGQFQWLLNGFGRGLIWTLVFSSIILQAATIVFAAYTINEAIQKSE